MPLNALQRRAVVGIMPPFLGVTPDASKGAAWRATVGHGYPFGEVEPTPAAPTGAGRGLRRRYPRRVSIQGVIHWVSSPEEERQLLRAHIEALEEQVTQAKAEAKPESTVKMLVKLVIRARNRLEAVDGRERDWNERLAAEDEEILMMLLH